MDFEQLAKIENESERVNRTYDIFNEDARLNHSKAARVEFLTTVHYIKKYLKDGDKILDIGAGAGEYSLYFARKGYEVSALELADANIAAFKKKLTPEDKIDLVQGNALDLSRYADKSFDIVLLFGPLYHLKNDVDKQKCISEAKRVCKDGGKIFFLIIDEIAMKLFRKKIPEKYEMAVNTVGFVALMGFMLVVTFNDVFKLFG